jgi:hypothetical protein
VAHVTHDANPGVRLSARRVFISPALQPETRTAKVRFEIANPRRRLKPGMYANVEIATTSSPAIVVPIDAVLDSGREQIVFVAGGDGTFTPRRVQIGARRQDAIEIASGLKEGEQVATSAAFFLDSESQLRSSFTDTPREPPAATAPAVQAAPTITLQTQPNPPIAGRNTFEVSVIDAAGHPVTGADVAILFFMPGMPAMGMPPMRNTVTLAPAGAVYRGQGEILMNGQWTVTVDVKVGGKTIAKKDLLLTAN